MKLSKLDVGYQNIIRKFTREGNKRFTTVNLKSIPKHPRPCNYNKIIIMLLKFLENCTDNEALVNGASTA